MKISSDDRFSRLEMGTLESDSSHSSWNTRRMATIRTISDRRNTRGYTPITGTSGKVRKFQENMYRFGSALWDREDSIGYASAEDFQPLLDDKILRFGTEVLRHKHSLGELQLKCKELALELIRTVEQQRNNYSPDNLSPISEQEIESLFSQEEYQTQARAENSGRLFCNKERTWYWPLMGCKKQEDWPVMWLGSTRRTWESFYRIFQTALLKAKMNQLISQKKNRYYSSNQEANRKDWGVPYPYVRWSDCLKPDASALALIGLGGAICIGTPIIWAISCVRTYCPEGYKKFTESYLGSCYSNKRHYTCTKHRTICEHPNGGRTDVKITWRDDARCRPEVLTWPEVAGASLIGLGLLIPTIQTVYRKTANALVNGTECCLKNMCAVGRWIKAKVFEKFDTDYDELDYLIDGYNELGIAELGGKRLTRKYLDDKYRNILFAVPEEQQIIWQRLFFKYVTKVLEHTQSTMPLRRND